MNISASQLSSSISSISNSNSMAKQLLQNRNMFTGQSVGDSAEISNQGMMMSKMMSRVKSLDPSQMAEKMNAVKSQIDGLDLENMDVSSMSRDELESTMTEIHDIMETLKPEGAEGKELNLAVKSDDELRDMITKFSDKAKQIEGGMGKLEVMGGMMKTMAQNGMPDMYQDLMQMPDDKTETDLMDMLLSALESDDEDENSSYFNQIVADYFSGLTL